MCVFVVPSMYVFTVMPHMSQNSMSLGYRFVNILFPYVMLYVQVDYYVLSSLFDDEGFRRWNFGHFCEKAILD